MKDLSFEDQTPAENAIQGAIRLLTPKDPETPWHRDGWMFQVMSWIAANIQNPESLKSPPQMIHAHKGFDGMHVCLDKTNSEILSIIVCEEKATSSPRGKITSQVWPDFTSLEDGERDNEIVSEISTILASNSQIDPDQAIHKILWEQARSYRVLITINDEHNSEQGRNNLFKGYEDVVNGGDVERRRAETLHIEQMREWLQNLSELSIEKIQSMDNKDV